MMILEWNFVTPASLSPVAGSRPSNIFLFRDGCGVARFTPSLCHDGVGCLIARLYAFKVVCRCVGQGIRRRGSKMVGAFGVMEGLVRETWSFALVTVWVGRSDIVAIA